mgnify:FL=1
MDLLVGLGRTLGSSFAATPVRAFRRRFGRKSSVGGAAAAFVAFLAVGLATQPQVLARPQQQQPPPVDKQVQPPIFRGGANVVRVDVFATKNGEPVLDLKAEDFEVFEDGAPQVVDNFEHVQIQGGGPAETRVEPRNVRESNQMAADPRARLFVLFLDTNHVHRAASRNVMRPLTNLLTRLVGAEDMIAVMTPDMPASSVTFTRRTDKIADMLERNPWWGLREGLIKKDPVEQMYEACYPPEPGRSTSAIAQEMIDRRREVQTLGAIEDLVRHLDGLREERKAILLVSEGWHLYRPNRALAELQQPRMPGVFVGPNGRLTGSNPNTPAGMANSDCDRDRMMLAQIDDERRFRNMLDEANRANASFYPIEPRGLVVFDTDLGPNPPLSPEADLASLRIREEALRTIAEATDGVAVIDSNNIDAGLKRVVTDLSSYYLLGYTSTNSKLDGRFRSIKVRVKRPGIEIRARRGYLAATEKEMAARAAAVAPVVDEATTAVTRSIATLENFRNDAALRLAVSAGWWTPTGEPGSAKPTGSEPALWILGEVDMRPRPGGDDWSQGGEADVAITNAAGETVVRYTVSMAPNSGRFLSRFPRTIEDVWLDPGSYAVKVRMKPAAGGLPSQDTARFDLPKAPAAGTFVLGQPIYFRRGSAAVAPDVPTADRRVRRTEKLAVQVSMSLPADRASAELLDRNGKPIPLPVAATTVERDAVRWARAELSLAPLAAGDYVIRITIERGTDKIQMLAPFRIIP